MSREKFSWVSANANLPYFLIFIVWLLARIYVYFYNWPYFIQDMTNDTTFHMWYLPPEFIKDNFFDSLLYLRGEPPLPQIILGTLIKLFGWPFIMPVDSFLLSISTLATAYLMHSIILRYGFRNILATIVASLWCIYPACLGVEVSAFPVAFYEALPSFIFILSLWICLKCFSQRTDTSRISSYVWLFGMAGAMLSMSRSTLSWIFFLPILVSIFLPGGKMKIVAGCLAITMQMSWALKNYHVYGQFNLETASDVGQNILSTLLNTGNLDNFYAYSIKKNPDDIFVSEGIACLIAANKPCIQRLLPETEKRDEELEERLGIAGKLYGESYLLHDISKKIKPLYSDFLLHNPIISLNMLSKSYKLFWGNIYWQVSYIKGLDADKIILTANFLMEKYKAVNIVAIHSIGVLAAFLIPIAGIRKKSLSDLQVAFLYTFLAFCYVAIISSLGDHGENARYRVDVEPLAWLLPFMAYRCLQQLFSRPVISNPDILPKPRHE